MRIRLYRDHRGQSLLTEMLLPELPTPQRTALAAGLALLHGARHVETVPLCPCCGEVAS